MKKLGFLARYSLLAVLLLLADACWGQTQVIGSGGGLSGLTATYFPVASGPSTLVNSKLLQGQPGAGQTAIALSDSVLTAIAATENSNTALASLEALVTGGKHTAAVTVSDDNGTAVLSGLGLTLSALSGGDILGSNGGTVGVVPSSTVDFSTGSVGINSVASSTGLTALMIASIVTADSGGDHTSSTGASFLGQLYGADVTGASVYGIATDANAQGSSGALYELTSIYVSDVAPNPSTPPITAAGIHIANQNAFGAPGTAVNAAILGDDQTAGANVYFLKSGKGPSDFGDQAAFGIDTLANWTSNLQSGYQAICSDCDTPIANACTSAGDHAGAFIKKIRGGLVCE